MRTSELSEEASPTVARWRVLLSRGIRAGALFAGPAVIVLGVLLILRGFSVRGQLTTQHPDDLSLFLPMWCLMGKSLASGHVLSWNAHVMGGMPFAADPLSGWGYAPVMILFSSLPCATAMRWFIVLQPILGGLGVYWFLRAEGVSRLAGTTGGAVLAFGIAGSGLILSLPFSATLAWTALLLAAAARMMAARTWPRRLIWVGLTALAWGQLAAAYLSQGTMTGSIALVLYLVAKGIAQLRSGERAPRDLVMLAGVLVLALPLLNLAYFLPRLSYLPRTSLGQGYTRLQQRLSRLHGIPTSGLPIKGIGTTTPIHLTVPGGVYVGALGFVLAFLGWRDRRFLHLAASFSLFGLASYVLALKWTARHVAHILGTGALGSLYLHETERLSYGVILAIAVLAGVGVEAWRRVGPTWQRVVIVLPGLAVWALIPVVLGLHRTLGWLPPLALAAGLLALAAAALRPVALALVAGVVVLEILTAAVLPASALGLVHPKPPGHVVRLNPYIRLNRSQFFPASDYFQKNSIARTLEQQDAGRYLSIAPRLWRPIGYHVLRSRPFWGFMAAQQSMLFGLEDGQGFNSIQLVRYWEFLRAVDPKPIRYNAAGFTRADPVTLDLLQVRYVIQPLEDDPAVAGERQVAQDGRWVLYELPGSPGRASLVTAWSVAPTSDAALNAILQPDFDPSRGVVLEARGVVLEGQPGLGSPSTTPAGGSVTYRSTGAQSAVIQVDAPGPSIVLVRNVYDPGWHATVDGRPARILPADYLVQGIPVQVGRHTIRLSYDDPSIGYGMLGSALAMASLFGLAGLLWLRRESDSTSPPKRYEANRSG